MSNDFASLLSNFASATGGATSVTATNNKKNEATTSNGNKKSLKELTTSLWQRSQLQQSVKSLKQNGSGADKADATTGVKSEEMETKPIHLAICLCVVDRVTHERVWEEWIRNNNSNANISAELYVHAKIPERITNSWTKSKLISISHRPDWNDVRIVKAMLSLAEEALKKDTRKQMPTHIVFGTESCIPICPLADVIVKHDTSYVQYYGKNQASRFDERDVWDVLRQHMPLDCIHKALPGWCTLASAHAQEILTMSEKHLEGLELWKAFDKPCWAPEEAFFPTALALLGLLNNTECKSLTYAEWNERSKRPEDKAHPKTWDREFDAQLVSSLRKDHGTIILRKVKYPVPVSKWQDAVFQTNSSSSNGADEERRGDHYSTKRSYHDESSNRYDDRNKRSRGNGGEYYSRSRGNGDDYYGRRHGSRWFGNEGDIWLQCLLLFRFLVKNYR